MHDRREESSRILRRLHQKEFVNTCFWTGQIQLCDKVIFVCVVAKLLSELIERKEFSFDFDLVACLLFLSLSLSVVCYYTDVFCPGCECVYNVYIYLRWCMVKANSFQEKREEEDKNWTKKIKQEKWTFRKVCHRFLFALWHVYLFCFLSFHPSSVGVFHCASSKRTNKKSSWFVFVVMMIVCLPQFTLAPDRMAIYRFRCTYTKTVSSGRTPHTSTSTSIQLHWLCATNRE